MNPPLLLRWDTQDVLVCVEVFENNEYRLPDQFKPTDVIVDVGANIGVFAYACLTRGCGKVICIEPEPDNFAMLAINMAPWGEKAEIHRCAAWSEDGELMLSKRTPAFSAMHHCMGGGDVPVKAVAMKHFLRDKVTVLKLDCEGSEKPILDSLDSLENVDHVIGEIHYQMETPVCTAPTDDWLRGTLRRLGKPKILILPSTRAPNYISSFFAKG